jgi:hypothetical protein
MFEKFLAVAVLAICVVLMVRLLIGVRLRSRLDAFARRGWQGMRHGAWSILHWRSARKNAAQVAEEAIRRARGEGSWEGNVYKPKSFKRPPRDKLH